MSGMRYLSLQELKDFLEIPEDFEANLDCLCTMYSRGYHLIPLFSLSGTIDKQGKVKEPKIDLRY